MPTQPSTHPTTLRNELASAAARLPSSVRVFERMNEAMRNPDVDINEITNVIHLDTAISLRVMRLANSAQFLRGEPFLSLETAIDWLGIAQIYHLLATTVSARLFSDNLTIYGIKGDLIWKNSVATAIASSTLADLADDDKHTGYSLGLFRPIGRMILQKMAGFRVELNGQGNLPTHAAVLDWERHTFSLNNAEAAEAVFNQWGLHPLLGATLRHHFSPEDAADNADAQWAARLYLAGAIVQKAGYGLPIEQGAWSVAPHIVAQSRVTRFDFDAIVNNVRLATQKYTG